MYFGNANVHCREDLPISLSCGRPPKRRTPKTRNAHFTERVCSLKVGSRKPVNARALPKTSQEVRLEFEQGRQATRCKLQFLAPRTRSPRKTLYDDRGAERIVFAERTHKLITKCRIGSARMQSA
eukprot:2412803-Amphidinium_carterae.1